MTAREQEMWARAQAACARFVPSLPKRAHWWSLPQWVVTTADIMAPLHAELAAIFRESRGEPDAG